VTGSEAATDEQSGLSVHHSLGVAQGLDHQGRRPATWRGEEETKQQADMTPGLSISREVLTRSPPPVLSAPWTSCMICNTALGEVEHTSWSLRRRSMRTNARPAMGSLASIILSTSSRVRLPGCVFLSVGYGAYHGCVLPGSCVDAIF
jgi:hypothetical protein